MPSEHPSSSEKTLSFAKKVWITGAIFSFIIILILLFKTLLSVLLLALAGILLAIYFLGCADFFRKKLHLSGRWSLALSIVINLLLIIVFFWFVGARLQNQISELSESLPQTIEKGKASLEQSPLGKKVLDYLNFSGNSQKTFSMARRFFSSTFGIVSDLYIVLLLSAFFIASPKTYKKGIVHLLPPAARAKGNSLLNDLYSVLKNWIKAQISGFLFIAVLTGIGLWIVGMPLILTLALLAGILNFIPNFGPVIALIPAGLLALTQGTDMAIIVICLYTFIQIVQSAVTQPLIQKKMVNLPPALVIFGQVAMGLVGGFWGVLLASPIVAILMTVVNKLYIQPMGEYKAKE